jgi:hypothetical protein
MNRIQKAAVVGASAVALGLGSVAAVPAAEAHIRGVGSVSTNEAAKIVRKASQQDCLTITEVRRITHGNGVLTVAGGTKLTYVGSRKSGIATVNVTFSAPGCATGVSITLR